MRKGSGGGKDRSKEGPIVVTSSSYHFQHLFENIICHNGEPTHCTDWKLDRT